MAAHLVLLLAAAALPALAQFPPAPGPDHSGGCTSKSFTIPSWFVQNVTHPSNNSIAFNVWNRATNYTASLGCPAGQISEVSWHACSIQGTPSLDNVRVSVRVSEKETAFQLNQTWTCNDRGSPVTFTAVGNSSAAQDYTSPVLVKGSLLAPVAITPQYARGPKGHASGGCTKKSVDPSWVLSTIHFTDEPGDGVDRVTFQNLNLIVTNPANGYQASCMPGGSLGGQPTLSQLMCAGDEFQSSVDGAYPVSTQASFDPDTLTFSLNQTWYCDDTDAAKPLQINAAGSIKLPLNCTTETVDTNETNRYCSSTGDVALPGKLGTVVTLAPYALDDPVPSPGDGCTLTSLFEPAWTFSSFEVDYSDDGSTSSSNTTSSGSGSPSVSFEIILDAANTGLQYPIPITQGDAVKGSAGWYACDIGPDGGDDLPLWPYRCSFAYAADTKQLQLKADWACRDLDRVHPVYFSGTTTTIVNSTLACQSGGDGQSQCATADPGYVWVAKMSNVTLGKSN